MKRLLSLFLVFKFFNLIVFSQNVFLNIAEESNKFNVTPNKDSISVNISLANLDFEIVSAYDNQYIIIKANDFLPTRDVAAPQLIQSNFLFEIPNGKKPVVKILNQKWSSIDLEKFHKAKLLPAQNSIAKTNPDSSFQQNMIIYSKDDFYSLDLVSIENIGFLNSYNLAKFFFSPLKYNPVKNLLLVCSEIELVIEFVEDDLNCKSITQTRNFNQNVFFDFIGNLSVNSQLLKEDKAFNINQKVSYLIITDSVFENTLAPFVNRKIQQGFWVETAYINSLEVGNNASSIKSFISSKFDNSNINNPAPTFVLLVGDIHKVPSGVGATSNHPSDWYYAQISPDFLPDLLIGRFSASDTLELSAIIQKSLNYEKFLFQNSSFLSNSLLVSGTDASFSGLQGNAHLQYVAQYYLNAQNQNNANLILYPQSLGSTNLMTQYFSNGVGIVNYTGHGTPSGWSDPSLNLANLSNIANFGSSAVVIANACLTAKFDNQTCIGEALHRKPNSGAIAYIGASNNTYWDEDFWWSVGYKPVIHNPQFIPNFKGMWDRWFSLSNPFSNLSQMIVAGNLAVEMSNSNFRNYYWEVYHVFGDPSLMPYQRIPNQLVASHQPFLLVGSNQLVVNTEPFAMVGFSKDNQLIASGFSNENGLAVLNFQPLTSPGFAKIVVSKQNRISYENDVLISLFQGSHVVNLDFDFVEMSSNPNGTIDYSDLLSFSFFAKNFGLDSISNAYAVLTSLGPYLNVLVDSINLGFFNSGDTKFFNEKFLVQVSDNVPNKFDAPLKLSIFSNQNVWESTVLLNVNSPVYQLSDYSFFDTIVGNNNFWFEPGETVKAVFEIFNNSDSYGKNITVNLSSNNSNLNLNSNSFYIDSIQANQKIHRELIMSLSQQTVYGEEVNIFFEFNDGIYSFFDTLVFIAGVLIEDFETNSFTKFPWFNGYNSESFPWEINSNQVFQGNFSASSGNITHNQFSELAIVIDVFEADSLSFYYKTSCENPGMNAFWDYLSFEVNNMVQKKWAGDSNWEEAKFLLPQGVHTLSWKYVKDNSISSFQDKVWVDNIVFPRKSRLLNTTSVVDELAEDFILIIYPNPANEEIFILADIEVVGSLTIEFTDVYGRVIQIETFDGFSNFKLFKKIDISTFKKGVYFVTLYFNSQKITKKIIVL